MARVTVEDCVLLVPNRFELVMLAGQRARNISAGTPLSVERDDDKDPVVALREIAEETLELDDLRDSLIQGLRKHVEFDEPEEEEEFDLLTAEEQLLSPETAPDIEEEFEEEIEDDASTVQDEEMDEGAEEEKS